MELFFSQVVTESFKINIFIRVIGSGRCTDGLSKNETAETVLKEALVSTPSMNRIDA